MDFTAIENISFKGKTRYLSCNSEGKARTVSDCPFGTSSFGETRGLSEFVKKHSYPTANIEETIGKTHYNRTYRIYVTDPTEVVNDTIKQNHDYIVYDVEPEFPEVRVFMDIEQERINKGFRNMHEYYQRLENDGLNRGNSHIVNLSKIKQRITSLCSKMVDESSDLRAEKLEAQNKLRAKQKRIQEIEANIPEYQKDLEIKQNKLTMAEQTLQKKEQVLSNWQYKQRLLKDKQKKNPDEINKVNYYTERNQIIVSNIKSRIEHYKSRIEFIENYISKAPSKIEFFLGEIKNLQRRIADINKLMLPHLKKLQEFYTVNGIKIIKRV